MNDWQLSMAKKCQLGKEKPLIIRQLENQLIINAGGLIASPAAFTKVAQLMLKEGPECDDQVAFNMFIYGNLITESNENKNGSCTAASFHINRQGFGNVNNIGWGGHREHF